VASTAMIPLRHEPSLFTIAHSSISRSVGNTKLKFLQNGLSNKSRGIQSLNLSRQLKCGLFHNELCGSWTSTGDFRMLEDDYVKLSTSDRVGSSWLAPPIESYLEWLQAHGYSRLVVYRRPPLLFHFAEFA
jgi:hypothetical protein